MSKIEDFNLERHKRLFMKHIHPHLEKERLLEQEFMDRIEREGISFILKPPLYSINGGKE